VRIGKKLQQPVGNQGLVMTVELQSRRLQSAFEALRDVLPDVGPRAPKQFYALDDLQTAFRALQGPLARTKQRGGLINVWALASLRRDEVRNAAALAGLWMPEFGGETSMRFAVSYLATALPTVDWNEELRGGYRVATEICPLGDGADRVDLVIETARHLVGIEIKIGAALGREQLQRYSKAISRRGALQGLTPWVVLLAPFRTELPVIASSSWADVARAARSVAGDRDGDRCFVTQLIESFGEHVREF
jgi:hypothetical protein